MGERGSTSTNQEDVARFIHADLEYVVDPMTDHLIPNLISTDVNQEAGRFCPKCGVDWRATQIPEESVKKDYYGHVFPCQRKGKWDDYYDPAVECSCPPRFYSNLIGIEHRMGGDRVNEWMCPACQQRWNRDTRQPIVDEIRTPYPWCRGNPTKQDCASVGFCQRNPNCGE